MKDILDAFVSDEKNYHFILINSEIINESQRLIAKYGIDGLRALDAIQLASACSISKNIDFALTADKLLNKFFVAENIQVSP